MKTGWASWLGLAVVASACGSSGAAGAGDGGSSPPGAAADYIRRAPHARLVIEVDSVPGSEPNPTVASALVSGLTSLLDKPSGIAFTQDKALTSRGTDHAWTDRELSDLAEGSFDLAVGADAVKMHVLFVDGHSADDSGNAKVLGLAFGGHSIVMFKQTIVATCTAAAPPLLSDRVCAAAEQGVWTHETGHLLGLVNNGIAMQTAHEDGAHRAHDGNDKCVMYWANEGTGIVDLLLQRMNAGDMSALGFDAQCLADIDAVKSAP